MKESIGSTFLYNIIFLFIIIVMGLIVATLNYYKSYKVNTRILDSLEKYSGYNENSKNDINRILSGIGYSSDSVDCSERDNASIINKSNICIYYYKNELSEKEREDDYYFTNDDDKNPRYYSYGVTTFISIELPIVGKFKVPVFTKGDRIFRFSCNDVRGCEGDNK